MKPYISLDIETTGLNHDSQVLQVAAILDDGGKPDELLTFDVLVDNQGIPMAHFSPYALYLNSWIFKAIADKAPEYKILTLPHARIAWGYFLQECMKRTGETKLTVAGKNVAGFDLPILKHNMFDTTKFSHRVIDPGSMYMKQFGYIPTLNEINKLTGRESVSHKAADDCMDVVVAVRKELGVTNEQ